jgi:hypothetical protein
MTSSRQPQQAAHAFNFVSNDRVEVTRGELFANATTLASEKQSGRLVPFHKQWGRYRNNPLVVEEGMTIEEAKGADPFGKGGGLLDGKIVREFPTPRGLNRRDAA